jgi:hypothetical protein
MFIALLIGLTIAAGQPAAKTVTLPDTPQGKHVEAYIKAFNSGDEKTFLEAHEQHLAKSVLDKRAATDRAQMFKRMRGDFGTLKIQRVVTATASQIQIIVPTKEGEEATMTFDFEAAPPYRISGLGIDVKGGER